MAILLKFRRVRQITGLFLKIVIVIAVLAVAFVVMRGIISRLGSTGQYVYAGIPRMEANANLLPDSRFFRHMPESKSPTLGKVSIVVTDWCTLCSPGKQGVVGMAFAPFGAYMGTIKYPDLYSYDATMDRDLVLGTVGYRIKWRVPSREEFPGSSGEGLEFLDQMDGVRDGYFGPAEAFLLVEKSCFVSSQEAGGSTPALPAVPWVTLKVPMEYEFDLFYQEPDSQGRLKDKSMRVTPGLIPVLSLPYLDEPGVNFCPNLPFVPGISLNQLVDFFNWDTGKMRLADFLNKYPMADGTAIYEAKKEGELQFFVPAKDPNYAVDVKAATVPVRYLVQEPRVSSLKEFWTPNNSDSKDLQEIKADTCPFTWVIKGIDLSSVWAGVNVLHWSDIESWYNTESPGYRSEFVKKVEVQAQKMGLSLDELQLDSPLLSKAQLTAAFSYQEEIQDGFAPINVLDKAWFIWAGAPQREGCVTTPPVIYGEPKGESILIPAVWPHTGEKTYTPLIKLLINQPVMDQAGNIVDINTWYGYGPAVDLSEESEITRPSEVGQVTEPEAVFGELPEVSASEPEGTEGLLVADQNGRLVIYDPNNNEVGLPSHWQLRIRYQIVDSERAVITWTDTPSPTQFAGFTIKLENIKTE